MAESQKILVADDDSRITVVLNEYFTRLGYTVLTAKTGKETLERVEKDHPALVLLDLTMPDMAGTEILRQIKARAPAVEVIVLTGSKDRVMASKSLALGARDYITKPVDLAYLERSVLTQLMSPVPVAPPATEVDPGRALAELLSRATSLVIPTPDIAVEPAAPSPRPAAEMDPGRALAELLNRTTARPVTPTPDIAVEPAAPSSRPEAEVDPGRALAELLSRTTLAVTPTSDITAESVVALATECFRLAHELTPPGLARGIEECALWLLEAVATGSDPQPHLKSLRLYLEVAHQLGRLAAGDLARLDALCRDLEEGRDFVR